MKFYHLPGIFIVLVLLLIGITQCRADTCWDKMAEGDNALWIITKSIAAPFVCIPSDIINQDYTYTGKDTRSIYTVTGQKGTTTYIVTPRTRGADIQVIK